MHAYVRVTCLYTRVYIQHFENAACSSLSFLLLVRFLENDKNKPLVVLRIDIAARPPIDIPSNDPTR